MQRLRNAQTEWARSIIDGFVSAGVRDAVISPGSRSTPLVYALLERPEVKLLDVIDERSAAFFALGQARITQRPTLLVCTSGTAAAHYFPAVVEASASGLPLLALTADRPRDLTHSGANQTIDQLHLYGRHARGFFELPSASGLTANLVAVRRLAAQAYARSISAPGAVHVNAPAFKPLEPAAAESQPERRLETFAAELRSRPAPRVMRPSARPLDDDVDALAVRLSSCSKGLIVCGPAALEQRSLQQTLYQLAERIGYPVLAESTSQLRQPPRSGDAAQVFADFFPILLSGGANRRALAPEMVLQIGQAPIAGGWHRLMTELPPRDHWVLSGRSWCDATQRAGYHLEAEPLATLQAVIDRLAPRTEPSAWLRLWQEHNERAGAAVAAHFSSAKDGLREGQVVRHLLEALPDEGSLVLGNSLPVRDVDTYTAGGHGELAVFHQRGVSGIDGLVAGALGVASQANGPTALLLGDVSLCHDLGSLALMRQTGLPLVVVIIDNGGGRIFDHLPIVHSALEPPQLDHWRTPPRVAFTEVARALGLDASEVTDTASLEHALDRALTEPKPTVIHAKVVPESALDGARLARHLDGDGSAP